MGALIENLRMFLYEGGFTSWLIFLLCVFLIVLGAEKIFYLYVLISFRSEKALERIRETVLTRQYTDAIQICSRYARIPELLVIKAGLLSVENGREAMRSALGGSLLGVSRKCETRIHYIAFIASASTLLGLLGTITGLIKTFAAMAQLDASEKARMLGSGISEAMFATAAGLIVGLLAMAIHTVCVSKIDAIVGKAQDAGYKLVTWVEQSERSKPYV